MNRQEASLFFRPVTPNKAMQTDRRFAAAADRQAVGRHKERWAHEKPHPPASDSEGRIPSSPMMARKIRYVPEGLLVEVTCRTFQGRYLFRPARGFREIFVGVLARARELYPVTIHFAVCLSNHFHLLVSPEDARQLAAFMRYVNTNVSKEAGRLHGWRGKIIERRYQAILVSDEPAAQIDRLRYLLSHGVKEGLVAEVFDWPGAHGGYSLATGHPMQGTWIDRTKEYAARNRGEEPSREQLETYYTLELAPLPCWRGKPAEVWRRYVREMIEEIEREGRKARGGKPPVGREALLRRDPHHRPDKLAWSAAPFIHAASRAMRWEIYRAYGHFIEAYYEAKEKLTAGDLTACFPTGCFPPPLPFLRLPTPA